MLIPPRRRPKEQSESRARDQRTALVEFLLFSPSSQEKIFSPSSDRTLRKASFSVYDVTRTESVIKDYHNRSSLFLFYREAEARERVCCRFVPIACLRGRGKESPRECSGSRSGSSQDGRCARGLRPFLFLLFFLPLREGGPGLASGDDAPACGRSPLSESKGGAKEGETDRERGVEDRGC